MSSDRSSRNGQGGPDVPFSHALGVHAPDSGLLGRELGAVMQDGFSPGGIGGAVLGAFGEAAIFLGCLDDGVEVAAVG